MAIKLTYSTIVLPVSTVLSKFEGGWDKWCALNNDDKLGPSWDDGHLFARASMDPSSIEAIARKWEQMGFVGEFMINGEKHWTDFCVPETGGHCAWLSYCDEWPAVVFLSDTIPGEIVHPKLARTGESSPERYGITPAVALMLVILAVLFVFLFGKKLYF